MTEQLILTERHGSVALITINIPAKLNALDGSALAQLVAAMELATADSAVAAIVLTGGEHAFCAGEDLTAAASMTQPEFQAQAANFQELARILLHTNKPTIAAVAGAAIGGGLEIALNCDVRIASPSALFGCPEAKWGMTVSNGASILLRRCVGEGWARDLMIFGRELDAQSALNIGLVTRLAPAGEVVSTALKLAAQVAQAPATGLGYAKSLLRDASPGVVEAIAGEEKALVESFDSSEVHDRIAGFATRKQSGDWT